MWNDGNFMEAFTADYSFLNADLASLYGVPAPSGEFELRAASRPTSRRSGLLGQASFLTSNAGPVETSPTARGIFIREQLLCQHVPNPPPGVNTQVPEPTADRPLARRQRMQAHVDNPTCASCHRLMDPIGFGLENYDARRPLARQAKRSSSRSRVPAEQTPAKTSRAADRQQGRDRRADELGVLRARRRSAACSPTAARARSASSSSCSATRSAGWRLPPIARPFGPAFTAFRESRIQVQGTAGRARALAAVSRGNAVQLSRSGDITTMALHADDDSSGT